MKVYLVSMMNAFILMVLGLWSFLGSENPSPISLIPIITGAFLLSLIRGLRYGSKPMAHISMVLTFLILIAMIVPFISALGHNDSAAAYRIGFMMVSCSIAIGFFVSKIIRVRKKRAKVNG
ncbi:MAG: hypothetical protein GZ094_10100 [Mariniphaga sp.]|nr:hypothetical protein [Mariniphaga sp.]